MTNSTQVTVKDALKLNLFNVDNGNCIRERSIGMDAVLEDVEFARKILEQDRNVVEFAMRVTGAKTEEALFDIEIPQFPFGTDRNIHAAYLVLLARVLIRSDSAETSAAMHARYSSPSIFKTPDQHGYLPGTVRNVINAKYLNLVNQHGPLQVQGVKGKLKLMFYAFLNKFKSKPKPVVEKQIGVVIG